MVRKSHKIKYTIQLFAFLILIACNENVNKDRREDNTKYCTVIDSILFKIDNQNSDSIGFQFTYKGGALSASACCVVGNYVFILDRKHNNIKKININEKKIEGTLDFDACTPEDITLHNNELYVNCGLGKAIMVYSTDFEFIKKVNPVFHNTIYLFTKKGKLMYETVDSIFLFTEVENSQKKGVTKNKRGFFRDYYLDISSLGNKYLLKTEQGNIVIENQLPRKENSRYWIKHFYSFDKKRFVYFDFSDDAIFDYIENKKGIASSNNNPPTYCRLYVVPLRKPLFVLITSTLRANKLMNH